MHVLWVTDTAAFLGGAERMVAATVRLLAGMGFEATLLYGLREPPDPCFLALFDRAFPMVDPRAQAVAAGPDVIYAHQVPGIEAVRAVTSAGRPAVRFIHDHSLFCLRGHKYTLLGRRTCRRILGPGCYACTGPFGRTLFATVGGLRREIEANLEFDAFIVGSGYMKEHAVAHGFPAGSIHVNPPFVVVDGGGGGPVGRGRDLLFVGSLVRGKGLDILLEALDRLGGDMGLDVVGAGRQEGMFRRLCSSLGLDRRVRFLGTLEPAVLDRFYRRAACVVVPSREPESFGMVGPEALARGTPVVASDAGGVREWLVPGVTGFVFRPGDPDDLARVLGEVLGDPPAALEKAAEGKRRVLSRFTPEAHAERLSGILRAVAIKGEP